MITKAIIFDILMLGLVAITLRLMDNLRTVNYKAIYLLTNFYRPSVEKLIIRKL